MNLKAMALGLMLAVAIPATTFASDDAKAAIKAAKDKYAEVKKAGFAWRDTEKMIKKAEKLAEKEPEKAIKMANKAKKQAENGLEQAKAAKNAGPRF